MNGGRALLIGQPVWERAHQPERRATFKDRKRPDWLPCLRRAVFFSAAASGGGGNTHKPDEDGAGEMVSDGQTSHNLGTLASG